MFPSLVNQRAYSYFHSLPEEFNFDQQKNYLFNLDYLSTISLEGARAEEFLQGQLTCDVRLVNNTTMKQGAYCNLQGRILALVDIINQQGFKLILPNDLIPATLTSLSKTALLSRVLLTHTPDYHIYGFYLLNRDCPPAFTLPDENKVIVNETGICYALDKQRFILLVSKEHSHALKESFLNIEQLRGSLAWHWLQIKHFQTEIYVSTRGSFLPHRLHLPQAGYISFDKGCYKGQEIIARTHYRAKTKHSLKQLTIHAHVSIESGDIFIDSSNNEIGEIIDFCPLSNDQYLILASLLLEHPNQGFIKNKSTEVIELSN